MTARRTLLHGLVAGLIGATILALWFLIIDTIAGQPFRTPAFLGRILFQMNGAGTSVAPILAYTLVHYLVFALTGVGVAWLLLRLEAWPPIVLGLVLGVVLFDLAFYLGVALLGVDIIDMLGWGEVLSGNLLAGVGTVVYLGRSMNAAAPDWLWTLAQQSIVREGVVLGVVGALTVAVWFLVVDLVHGRIFFTPGALGSALFLDVGSVADIRVNFATVGGYTVVHFAAFFVVGLVAATIAVNAERFPPLLLAGLLLFVTFEAFFLGVLAVTAEWLLGEIGWLSVGVGNLLATVAVALMLWRKHPNLRTAIKSKTLAGDDDGSPV